MTANAPTTERVNRSTPPFLMLAALTFWGWQSGLLVVGVVMGLGLESSRFIKLRFEFSAVDFRRIWNFCGLLGLALALYAFSSDEEVGGIGNLLHGSDAGRNAVASGLRAATIMPRWLPMILFLFVAAQNFSEAGEIPLTSISMLFRWRQRNAGAAFREKYLNVAYPYLLVCLFSAGIHTNEGSETYFWGLCVLIAWALWPHRSKRFPVVVWLGAFVLAFALAYGGNWGVRQLEQLAQNYNAQWMSHLVRQRTDPLHARTFIGQLGELKLSSAIVIRLETQNGASPPAYLHEASYLHYNAQAWSASEPQNDFQDVSPATIGGNDYDLFPGKSESKVVNLACYLTGWSSELKAPAGLLPLPSGCARLEHLPGELAAISKNRTGAVLAVGPGFLMFNARYGGVRTIDSPPVTNWDLAVPTAEVSALERVITEMKISGTNDEEKELAVAQFFAQRFTYRTWQGFDKTPSNHETPLARFLLETRSGQCEYFATATVLLLRELGIYARYAVGFYVHESNGDNEYVVRERDAHAWCLVWNKKNKAWEDFDTTPGSWVAEEGKRASALQSLGDFFSWLHFQFSKFMAGKTHLRQYILWALGPVMLFLLYQIIFRRGRRRAFAKTGRQNAMAVMWPGLDSEFYLLENRLAARGVPRQPGEALADWLERILAQNSLVRLRAPLLDLLQLHYRHRFDPDGLSPDDRKLLAEKVRDLLHSLEEK
jgi:hypothetical protein